MAPLLKLFGESATASEPKVFFWARLKLTAIYVLILAVILIGFSTILYESLVRNLVDANDDNFAGVEFHHQFVQNTLSSVRSEIIIIDIFILLAAAAVSYIVAGYTLRPIQRSLEAQKNSLDAQKKFSENASHELRTPIAVMKNDAEVLLRSSNPTKDNVYATLRSNIEEMDRMTAMTADLLMLARSEHQTISVTKVDLREIVKATAKRMLPLAQKKGVLLGVAVEQQLLVDGNAHGLERVLMNLLHNAVEHTPNGGSISVAVVQEGKQAVVMVADTGSGIDAKDLPHLFLRFYKGEGASGSGLGLSIVQELIEQHGGSVAIASEKDTGTTVTIRLPLVS